MDIFHDYDSEWNQNRVRSVRPTQELIRTTTRKKSLPNDQIETKTNAPPPPPPHESSSELMLKSGAPPGSSNNNEEETMRPANSLHVAIVDNFEENTVSKLS